MKKKTIFPCYMDGKRGKLFPFNIVCQISFKQELSSTILHVLLVPELRYFVVDLIIREIKNPV